MPAVKNIVIVGGGVIGLCVANAVARRGHRVTVLERGDPSHDCCSMGNAGMIVPSHFIPLAAPGMVTLGLRMMFNPRSPFYIKPRLSAGLWRWAWQFWRSANARHVAQAAPLLRDLSLASRRCFEELADRHGNSFGLVKKGLLMLCKTGHTFHEETQTAAMARELGLSAQVMAPDEAARLDPGLRMDIAGAIHFPQDCHLTPHLFMAALAREAADQGVKFAWQTEVLGWRTQAHRVQAVRTSEGELQADEYVIAAGSWAPHLTRDLGIHLPIQPGKGYSLTLAQPRKKPEICSILSEARVAVTPMGTALRFGGTMEMAGLDQDVNPVRVEGIVNSIPRYYPEFQADDFRNVPVWRGLRPCSPDGLPYIGRFKRYHNLSAAAGHAMMGLSLGPVTGQLMAEVLSDETPCMAIPQLSPDRFDRQ